MDTLPNRRRLKTNPPESSIPSPEPTHQMEMSLSGHFAELRKRLFISVIILLTTTFISFTFTPQIINLLAMPVGGLQHLQSIEVVENVGVFMRVALLSGFFFAFPLILIQVTSFIAPGLHPTEINWLKIGAPVASLLFLCGILFTYFIMLRSALPFLLSFIDVQTVPRLSNYINFTTNLMFWIGLSFETPLVFFLLVKIKIVRAKTLIKHWRIAIVIVAVLAAVISPTVDPINMGLIMLPLFALYLLSILFAFVAQ